MFVLPAWKMMAVLIGWSGLDRSSCCRGEAGFSREHYAVMPRQQLLLPLALETSLLDRFSLLVASRANLSALSPAAANPTFVVAQGPGCLQDTMRAVKKSQNTPK
jgi:hypothetical protein